MIRTWVTILTGALALTGGVMADYEHEDEIVVRAESPGKTPMIDDPNRPPGSVAAVDVPPDPCLDLESVEFALGECLGPVTCRGSAGVSTTGLTEQELRNLRANTTRHGVLGGTEVNFCGSTSGGGSGGESLGALVEQQWRHARLPRTVISLEPADGLTLVNLGTYMQAEQRVFRDTLTLMGQDVYLRATPVMWHWDHGDGTAVVSEDHAGSYYPDSDGWHAYYQPGVYDISVTIDWRGEYSIDNSQWFPIYGIGKTTSTTEVEVIEHRPRLETLKTK